MKKNQETLRSSSGFTLIELIVVLIIIGIAAGLAGIYVVSSSDNLSIRTFTKDMSAVLRYARNHATAEKRIYHFDVDVEGGTYRLYADGAGAEDKPAASIERNIPDGLEVIVENTDEDIYEIDFLPLGNSSGGLIEVRNEKAVYIISVGRVTGRVDVERGE
jgi:general secretion pathway protein H